MSASLASVEQSVTPASCTSLAGNTPVLSTNNGLTNRQVEVARLASFGLNTVKIALRLNISYRTVESHLEAIYRILRVNNRTQLVGLLFRNPALLILAKSCSGESLLTFAQRRDFYPEIKQLKEKRLKTAFVLAEVLSSTQAQIEDLEQITSFSSYLTSRRELSQLKQIAKELQQILRRLQP